MHDPIPTACANTTGDSYGAKYKTNTPTVRRVLIPLELAHKSWSVTGERIPFYAINMISNRKNETAIIIVARRSGNDEGNKKIVWNCL